MVAHVNVNVTGKDRQTQGLEARLVVRRGDQFELDLTLEVSPGETLALLGPNGAGKSTTLSALAGIVPIEEGRITLDGAILDEPAAGIFVPPEKRSVGLVFQDYVLFPHLSVVDNVAFGPRSRGRSSRVARTRALDWLERLEIASLAHNRPAELSGGQAQRVALARALASEPALLLLDEPLAALDVTTHARLRRVLDEHLTAFEGPRVLISHDPTDAVLLADRIHVVENGRTIQIGTPDEMRRHPRTLYVADLAGSNLLKGVAEAGRVTLAGGHPLHIADTSSRGPVLVHIAPRVISLHPSEPHGSPRNTWSTTVTTVERLGDRVRVELGAPLPLTVEITPAAAEELHLSPGAGVWVAIKATEITSEPDIA